MNKPIKREGFVAEEETPKPAAATTAATAETPASEAPFAETWPIKVRLLHRAIRNNKNEEVRELLFREPTGGDINRWGNPCRIDQNGEVIIDEQKMTMVMAALAGILSPNLSHMDPRDWNSCAYRLRSFFLPEPAAW